ncbi:MAG: hypothetical protein AMJ43_02865 [Coxiella sp. DG_40]|nr:MAG: hypothetical protein AMJ43_02865 [Coxiella sp. DG_40]
MNIHDIYKIIGEYKRSLLVPVFFIFYPARNLYMDLLHRFVDEIARPLSQNGNINKNVILERDVSFAEFERYLEDNNQFESFTKYLTEQQKKAQNQDLAYKLIMTWKAEEYNREHINHTPEIWDRIFEYLPLRDAVRVGHVCRYLNDISQRFIVSQRLCLRGPKKFTCLAISGNTLVTGSSDHIARNTARIWDLTTGECRHILEGHKDCVTSLIIFGNTVVTGGGREDRSVRIWDLTTGKCQQVLRGYKNRIVFLAILGNTLIAGSDNEVRISNLTTMRHWQIPKKGCYLSCYVISGNILAIGGYKTASIWNVTNGVQQGELVGHKDYITCLAISGNTLVTGSSDYTARIWDLNTRECRHILQRHEKSINCLAISGTKLITGSSDNTARIWNLSNGKHLKVLKGHGEPIFYLAISGDTLIMGNWCLAISGNTLVTLSRMSPTKDNKFVKLASIWSLTTRKCQQVLMGSATEDSMYNKAKIRAWFWNLPPKEEIIENSETAVSVISSCNLKMGAITRFILST